MRGGILLTVDFSNEKFNKPTLVLKNISGAVIQSLGFAINVHVDIHYNELSKLTFDVPAYVNGERVPHYEDIIGMRIVDFVGVGQFILVNPEVSNDGVKEIKSCMAYSLEYELTSKYISLEESTYNLCDQFSNQDTILGIITSEYCPSWSIGNVSASLYGKYRTFDVENENVYNFIKNTLQEKYRCIFDFDTYHRRINVISVDDIVSSKPVYLSLNNLLKDVSVEEDTENIFTCLNVTGGEDVDIRVVNPMGSNRIYNIDYLIQCGQLSPVFAEKWNAWKSHFESVQDTFYDLNIRRASYLSTVNALNAGLTRMSDELVGLEAIKSTYLSAIAQGDTSFESKLAEINQQISAKNAEISSANEKINSINSAIDSIDEAMAEVKASCEFSEYFSDYVCPRCGQTMVFNPANSSYKCEYQAEDGTVYGCGLIQYITDGVPETELNLLNRCFVESSLEDSSFVVKESSTFRDGETLSFKSNNVAVSISNVTSGINPRPGEDQSILTIYDGTANIEFLDSGNDVKKMQARIIRGTLVADEGQSQSSFTLSLYLDSCSATLRSGGTQNYGTSNLTITGLSNSEIESIFHE